MFKWFFYLFTLFLCWNALHQVFANNHFLQILVRDQFVNPFFKEHFFFSNLCFIFRLYRSILLEFFFFLLNFNDFLLIWFWLSLVFCSQFCSMRTYEFKEARPPLWPSDFLWFSVLNFVPWEHMNSRRPILQYGQANYQVSFVAKLITSVWSKYNYKLYFQTQNFHCSSLDAKLSVRFETVVHFKFHLMTKNHCQKTWHCKELNKKSAMDR